MDQNSRSGLAYRNIARRVTGEDVPVLDFDEAEGFFKRLKKMIGMK